MSLKELLSFEEDIPIAVQIKLRHSDHLNSLTGKAMKLLGFTHHALIPDRHAVRHDRQRPFTNKVVPALHQTQNRNGTLLRLLDDMQIGAEQPGENNQLRAI